MPIRTGFNPAHQFFCLHELDLFFIFNLIYLSILISKANYSKYGLDDSAAFRRGFNMYVSINFSYITLNKIVCRFKVIFIRNQRCVTLLNAGVGQAPLADDPLTDVRSTGASVSNHYNATMCN